MNARFLVFVLLTVSIIAVAQNVITRELNLPRSGDVLTKFQVEFISPGEKGENLIWDYSNLSILDAYHKVSYRTFNNDTCIVRNENRSRFDYRISGDTLLWLGFENRLTKLSDSIPGIGMIYPLAYGMSFTKNIYLKGCYSMKNGIAKVGRSDIDGDSYGTLVLPEGDTIGNVLRVHLRNYYKVSLFPSEETSPININNDSLETNIEDTYQWYAAGYRYPLVETVINTYISSIGKKEIQGITCLYPPKEQSYEIYECNKSNSPNNKISNKHSLLNSKNDSKDTNLQNSPQISYNENTKIATVDYSSNYVDINPIDITVFDLRGIVFYHTNKLNQNESHTQINCSMFPEGQYFIAIKSEDHTTNYEINIK